jgi:hypothetical protein
LTVKVEWAAFARVHDVKGLSDHLIVLYRKSPTRSLVCTATHLLIRPRSAEGQYRV